jgi:hypothetical protein
MWVVHKGELRGLATQRACRDTLGLAFVRNQPNPRDFQLAHFPTFSFLPCVSAVVVAWVKRHSVNYWRVVYSEFGQRVFLPQRCRQRQGYALWVGRTSRASGDCQCRSNQSAR